jgi:D-amino-acid dehydrogenase
MHSYRFLRADKIVISAGAFSRQIELSDAEKLPLDTERGYHIQYAEKQHLANRPIAWPECGFYATPMNEGLRFAGTVELAGLSDKKNQARIDYLVQKSREMFKLDGPPTSDWLGFRPTLPDSLPVIGGSRRFPDTYYAFGHQHIGLTLAGITGKLISELISTGEPSVDISPFSPDRFMKKLARRF